MDKILNEDYLVSSPDYSRVISGTVLPALQKLQEDRTISGKGGTPLFCSVFRAENPIGTVLLLHGFTESAYKYTELIYSLVMNRFSVLAYDQRGHGRSGRAEGLAHPCVTHVDRFGDYVEDLKIVCDTLLSGLPRPWCIFSHSMGGAVTSRYLEQYRDTFSAASLCAPMIAPYTMGIPSPVVSAVCGCACLLGRGKHYPFFMKLYNGPEDFESSCATDPARFAWYDAVKASGSEFCNSVPTYRWLYESIGVTRKILAKGAPERISCPVLLSTAELDTSVRPDPQEKFISRVPNGRHLFVKEARHEIFRSVNEVFFPWWHEILNFLKEASA